MLLTTKDIKNPVLIEYKRNSKGMPIGVVIAIEKDCVGWSLCHEWDTYQKEVGIDHAIRKALSAKRIGRLQRIFMYENSVPNSMADLVDKMLDRSELYYKDEMDIDAELEQSL